MWYSLHSNLTHLNQGARFMNYKIESSIHATMAKVHGEKWKCDCASCERARQKNFNPKTTERFELAVLLFVLGEEDLSNAISAVDSMPNCAIMELLPQKRASLIVQLKLQKSTAGSDEFYQNEFRSVIGKTSGGGRRIIRKSEPLGG